MWILGGAGVVRAWCEAGAPAWAHAVERQTHHVPWHGFAAWDLIFPLFLFLAGVSLPFSYATRRARGATRQDLALHALRRGATLVLLGAVYNGLLAFDWDNLRLASVLGRIGLAYTGAALIVLALPRLRDQLLAGAGLLAASWALLSFAAPGEPEASLELGRNLFDWFDQRFLPGRLHQTVHDPEGLLATLPAIVTALAGVWTGQFLRGRADHDLGSATILAGAGLVALLAGGLWSLALPLNKHLWTPSFVVWCAGWSLLALAVFHLFVDVLHWRRFGHLFAIIGANSILFYLASRFIDWNGVAALALGRAEGRLHPALIATGGLALQWGLAAWLYSRRWFLRV